MNVAMTGSCSVKELAGLNYVTKGKANIYDRHGVVTSTKTKSAFDAITLAKGTSGAWIFWWSDIEKDYSRLPINYRYGEALAAYIEKYKLGTIVVSPPAIATNNGHSVKMWMWAPDWPKLKGWTQEMEDAVPPTIDAAEEKPKRKRVVRKKVVEEAVV